MFILYGTKEDNTIEPVAVFETIDMLSNYVNALTVNQSEGIDKGRLSQSVLAGYIDHQTITVGQVYNTREDWVNQLVAAKKCPFNPVCEFKDTANLEAQKLVLQATRDKLDAELAAIEATLLKGE